MVSLNTLRTKFGVVLMAVIGLTLLAFILGDITSCQDNNPDVGEIDGDEVSYTEFQEAYEDVRTLYGNNDVNYDQSSMIVSQAWMSLFLERIFLPACEEMGLTVTENELEQMKAGVVPSSVFASSFTDPATGVYDINRVNAFIDQVNSNPQAAELWRLLKEQAHNERVISKFNALVGNGVYANKLDLQKGLVGANNTYNGRFVVCNYTSIPDSLVSVSDKEIKSYYSAHMAAYKQKPYRTVSYVRFDVEPTEGDKQAAEAKAKAIGEKLAASTDLTALSREELYVKVAETYVDATSLEEEEAGVLRKNKTFGPELQGDEWYASRVVESLNAPKSVELKGFAVEYNEVAKADSLYNAAKAKGADFDALSEANNGVELGEIPFSQLPTDLAEAVATAKVDDVVKVNMGGAIQIFKVVNLGEKSRHYRLATLNYPVLPSEETRTNAYTAASNFSVNAKGSMENFNKAAAEANVMASQMNVERGVRNIPGLPNSIEVVRWANEAGVGSVSDVVKIDDSYVVAAVSAVNNDEHKSMDKVKAQIKSVLLKEKKAELIREKMKGATLEEIAAAAGASIENFADAKTSASYVQNLGIEPRVLAQIAKVTEENKGTLLPLVNGGRGVYAVVVDEVAVEEKQTLEAERVRVQAVEERKAGYGILNALYEAANVVDNTVKYF